MPWSRSSGPLRSTSSRYQLLPPSMIVSPASSSAGQALDGRADERGRHHDPHVAGRAHPGDELLERPGAVRALALELGDRVGAHVVGDAFVPARHQPADHVGAHPSEADHAELHCARLPRRRLPSRRDGCASSWIRASPVRRPPTNASWLASMHREPSIRSSRRCCPTGRSDTCSPTSPATPTA